MAKRRTRARPPAPATPSPPSTNGSGCSAPSPWCSRQWCSWAGSSCSCDCSAWATRPASPSPARCRAARPPVPTRTSRSASSRPGWPGSPRRSCCRRRRGPRTVRVVVLGESAAQGDPEPTFGVSRFLEAMLEEAAPGVRFEVVNAGVVAINSHVLVPMARDLARHAPDVVVVYAGNNEVVGPYGPGTVLTGAARRASGSSAPPSRSAPPASGSCSARSAGRGGRTRPPSGGGWSSSSTTRSARTTRPWSRSTGRSRGNLADVVAAFRERGARVVVSTVGTRLRDFAPFASAHRPGLDAPALERWKAAVARGEAAEHGRASGRRPRRLPGGRGDRRDLRASCNTASDGPRSRSETTRWRGSGWPGRATWTRSASAPTAAWSSSPPRWRATAGPGVELVDGAGALAAASPHGLPGPELFWEHAHLTPEGNEVLARALFPAVVRALPASAGRARRRAALARAPGRAARAHRLQPVPGRQGGPPPPRTVRPSPGSWTMRSSSPRWSASATRARASRSRRPRRALPGGAGPRSGRPVAPLEPRHPARQPRRLPRPTRRARRGPRGPRVPARAADAAPLRRGAHPARRGLRPAGTPRRGRGPVPRAAPRPPRRRAGPGHARLRRREAPHGNLPPAPRPARP